MNNLITVSGVSGYIGENGAAYLRLEDVARGLGFTEKGGYIRWQRVEGYLQELNFSTSGERPEYVPENIFYRLAMKAKNETAERFQSLVADEILPAIRRTGTYTVAPMTQAEILAAQAKLLVDIERQSAVALETANHTSARLDSALETLAKSPEPDWQTSAGESIKRMCKENGLSYVVVFGDLYKELEQSAKVDLSARLRNLQRRMQKSGATYKERKAVSKLQIISMDAKLRLAFDGIVRRVSAQYVA